MTIDHLVFNRLKWFNVADNADSVTANGKDYEAVPQQVKIPKNTKINLFNSFNSMDIKTEKYVASDTVLNCIGVIGKNYCCSGKITLNEQDEFQVYFGYGSYGTQSTIDLNGSKDEWHDESYSICVVPKSQVQVVKWGGKALLSHLCQWFKSLCRMEAII
ncbi:hypothetical protein [Lactobacillus helveticus]|uniref:Putative enoyl-CoA hydratase/isomerase n=1 Tax=Lactobacillus helveticus CIRM-BIA 104 TaxID=1226333 RepID=U6FCQ5_LACHE|nr:hypothetical protein [Lactobacillus helveticus]KXN77733.1 hypothetical protein AY470_01680 [Lactobacillus helveticus]MCT3423886.1 hypothetical protein [Lactobacillus helveticus]CDI60815.1 Putative enoyl-CoA hydratase/isomerase [Lactobacillus helveticus CIRM-BIA 104]